MTTTALDSQLSDDVLHLTGKTCLITGATSGIGKATAVRLAGMGATIIIVCRDKSRGKATAAEIGRVTGNGSTALLVGDLSEQRDIRRIADEFTGKYDALHLLVNNAGAVYPRLMMSGDGIEKTFALNQMAYFLLTMLLLDRLRQSAPSRIINITSATYRYVKIRQDDLVRPRRYAPFRRYAVSKLANILFTGESVRRLDGSGVTAACIHPGGVRTPIYDSTLQGRMFTRFFGWQLSNPDRAAAAIVDVATSKKQIDSGHVYYELNAPAVLKSHATDQSAARELWSFCEGLVRMEK